MTEEERQRRLAELLEEGRRIRTPEWFAAQQAQLDAQMDALGLTADQRAEIKRSADEFVAMVNASTRPVLIGEPGTDAERAAIHDHQVRRLRGQ